MNRRLTSWPWLIDRGCRRVCGTTVVTIILEGRYQAGVDRMAGPYVVLPDQSLVLGGAEKCLQPDFWAQIALHVRFLSAIPARVDHANLGLGLLELFNRGGRRGDITIRHCISSCICGLEGRCKRRRMRWHNSSNTSILLRLRGGSQTRWTCRRLRNDHTIRGLSPHIVHSLGRRIRDGR